MNSGEPPNVDGLDLDKNTSTHLQRPFEPFHRTKDGIIIFLLFVIITGAIVGVSIAGWRTSVLNKQIETAPEPITETLTTTVIATITPTTTTTLAAPVPTLGNCFWQQNFCNSTTCKIGYTTVGQTQCGNGGLNFYCCQEGYFIVPNPISGALPMSVMKPWYFFCFGIGLLASYQCQGFFLYFFMLVSTCL